MNRCYCRFKNDKFRLGAGPIFTLTPAAMRGAEKKRRTSLLLRTDEFT